MIRACCSGPTRQTLVNLVRELAVYEKLEAFARATPDDFRTHLFGPRPCRRGDHRGGRAATSSASRCFSRRSPRFAASRDFIWKTCSCVPSIAGWGIGKALLAAVAQAPWNVAAAGSNGRCSNWNAPAIGFYVAVGARPMDEWTVYRIDDEALARLAALAP